ncbi:hypothetical protein Gasu2_31770 [Galdieria sulphuraria]|nr:hypothetical protein Gasu2_31770 [Galdieria sulphuraria]
MQGPTFSWLCYFGGRLSAAYIEALYVYFICKIALSKFPSAGKLLSKVIPSIRRGPFEWLMIEKVPVTQ